MAKVTKSEIEKAKARIREHNTRDVHISNFTFKGELLRIEETLYTNKTPCLLITDSSGSPYAKLTVALEDKNPEPGCYFIKAWSENTDIAEVLRKSGIFEDTGQRVATGYTNVEVWRRIDKNV